MRCSSIARAISLAGLGLGMLATSSTAGDPTRERDWLDLDGVGYEEAPGGLGEAPPGILGSLKTVYASDEITVTWGGRLYIDWGWFTKDGDYPVPAEDGTEIRSARFLSRGTLYGHVDFKLQLDFANGDADLEDAFLRWQSRLGDVLVGQFKEPIGLEELTSTRYITFMERSMMNMALIPSRNSGIMLADTIANRTNWAIFFGRETDNSGKGTGDGEYVYTGRVAHWIPMGENGDGIHVGAGSSWRNRQDDEQIRTRPEAHLLDYIIDSGSGTTNDGGIYYNASSALVKGPFSIQGEYTGANIRNWSASANEDDVHIFGYYVEGSYFLTGEHRPYREDRGSFTRVRPFENWDGKSFKGAWQVAARYSYISFDDGNFVNAVTGNEGAKSHGITLGLNYYLNPNTRIMVNVLRNRYEDDDISGADMTAAVLRFQVDW